MHARSPISVSEVFSLGLYSTAIYAVLGLSGMAVIGAIVSGIIRVGRYSIKGFQLAGVFIAVFALLTISVLQASNIIYGNSVEVIQFTVIAVFSGVGLGGISVYLLGRGIQKEKLVFITVSLLLWIVIVVYGGLWLNLGFFLAREKFLAFKSLLFDAALLIVASLVVTVLYIGTRRLLKKYTLLKRRPTAYITLAVAVCAFITVSFLGPFDLDVKQRGTSISVENERPNILWIVMDTVRADHISCYGYQRNTSPNLDGIASEGILFENVISAGPWTLPSHASMFTGLFPSKHGTDAEHPWLDYDFQTISEVLSANGYMTFGYTNNLVAGTKNNLDQGFKTFEQTERGASDTGPELSEQLKISYFRREVHDFLLIDDGAYETNEVVKKWIADAEQAEAPFFLFINYMEAHEPYHPPPAYAAPFLPSGVKLARAMKVNQQPPSYLAGNVKMDAEDFEILNALYDGGISYLDFRMGQLFDYLRELEVMDDTIIIITSDHGENFGEHKLMGHHFCLYDTLLHVPLVIRYPELFEPGVRVSEQVQLTDLFPTILDMLDIDWDRDYIQGSNLLSKIESPGDDYAIAECAPAHGVMTTMKKRSGGQFDYSVYARRLKAVRTEEFKYIWASDGLDELYNLKQDPAELTNIIDSEPEKAAELRAVLKQWLNSFENYRWWGAQQVP